MEEELNSKMEIIRKKIEALESQQVEEIQLKNILNDLNQIKIEVYKNGIFSDNEEFTEIKTEDLKYLLIPYYQSEIMNKFQENRESVLNYCLIFYEEFFKLLDKKNYLTKERKAMYKELTRRNEDEEIQSKPTFEDMQKERDFKIHTFNYKKAISAKLLVYFF